MWISHLTEAWYWFYFWKSPKQMYFVWIKFLKWQQDFLKRELKALYILIIFFWMETDKIFEGKKPRVSTLLRHSLFGKRFRVLEMLSLWVESMVYLHHLKRKDFFIFVTIIRESFLLISLLYSLYIYLLYHIILNQYLFSKLLVICILRVEQIFEVWQ